MLAHRLRRWSNIGQTSGQRLVSAGWPSLCKQRLQDELIVTTCVRSLVVRPWSLSIILWLKKSGFRLPLCTYRLNWANNDRYQLLSYVVLMLIIFKYSVIEIRARFYQPDLIDQTWLGVRCHPEWEFRPLLFSHSWIIQGPESTCWSGNCDKCAISFRFVKI